MKLTLVRHGISKQDGNRVVDGDLDLDLSPEGIKDVKRIAPFVDEDQFDLIYSSTLQRAYKTAQILTKNRKNIIKDSRLVELRMGQWKSPQLEQEAYKNAFDHFKNVQENYIDYANNAETFAELKKRERDFLDDILRKDDQKTIMVVAHGITFRALMAVMFHSDMKRFMNMNNVAFTEIYFDSDRIPQLMSFNIKCPVSWGLRV